MTRKLIVLPIMVLGFLGVVFAGSAAAVSISYTLSFSSGSYFNCTTPCTVTINDASTDPSDPSGLPASQSVVWGDGAISYNRSPSHTYTGSGTTHITVTVVGHDGSKDGLSTDIAYAPAGLQNYRKFFAQGTYRKGSGRSVYQATALLFGTPNAAHTNTGYTRLERRIGRRWRVWKTAGVDLPRSLPANASTESLTADLTVTLPTLQASLRRYPMRVVSEVTVAGGGQQVTQKITRKVSLGKYVSPSTL